ncbi:membrane protein [Bacteroidia bacterium]|nr:membrane protein [Bacteroidia bacterium]
MALLPYSRFGIGELQTAATPRSASLGNTTLGLVGANETSSYNPASYINIDSLTVGFDLSMRLQLARLTEIVDNKTYTSNSNHASVNTFNLCFPITSWVKSSFGLRPTSNVSYDVNRQIQDSSSAGDYNVQHFGTGGLNDVYIGFALGYKFISVGANFNYHFGYFQRHASLTLYDTLYAYAMTSGIYKTTELQGFNVDYGMQLKFDMGKSYRLGFGFTYVPKYTLNADSKTEILATISSVADTVSRELLSGKVEMPSSLGVGVSFAHVDRWMIIGEYRFYQYSQYRDFGKADPFLKNAYTCHLGAEIKGNRYAGDIFSQMDYRVGFRYGKDYVAYQNNNLLESAITFGFGIPVRRSLSRIDIGVEIGRKGNTGNGQIQENYGLITIGLAAFETWFVRQKFR